MRVRDLRTLLSFAPFAIALMLSPLQAAASSDSEHLVSFGWSFPEVRSQIPSIPSSGSLRIERVRTPEARSTRGLFLNAIDGRTDSLGYKPSKYGGEWPAREGYTGVRYERMASLNVFLRPDEESFDYMFLRGSLNSGRLLEAVPDGVWEPDRESGSPSWANDGAAWPVEVTEGHFRWLPPAPIETPRLTFIFEDEEYCRSCGTIDDLQLYRLNDNVHSEVYVGTSSYELAVLDPSDVRLDPDMESRFAWYSVIEDDDACVFYPETPEAHVVLATSSSTLETPVDLDAGQFLHIATPGLPAETAIGGISLRLNLVGIPDGEDNLVRVIVTDVFDTRSEIATFDVKVDDSGELRLEIDIPDQIVTGEARSVFYRGCHDGELALVDGVPTCVDSSCGRMGDPELYANEIMEQRLWISLASERAVEVSGATGEADLQLHFREAAVAKEEYVEHRFNLVRNAF